MASPRLYRFYNYEQKQYAPAPVGGWNADAPVPLLAETQAPVLDNFLIRPGKIVCRGSFSVWADLTANAPLNICGVHPHLGDTNIIIGRKAVSASAYIDPWNAPIIRPPAAASIAAPSTTVLIAQGGTTITSSVQTAAKVPGPRGITFEGLRYYIGYGTSSAPVADAGGTYFAQSTSLCTQSGASTFTELTNAPHGAVDIHGHLSRIWLLGGIDTPGAGTTFSPLALFFTNPIGNGGGTASADWKDPVTGLTNKIVMDGDFLDPGVGMATVRNGLIVFRESSTYILRGTTSATFTLQPLSNEAGCIDARSIVECDRGVYFLSRKGLMLTDGAAVKNITGPGLTQTLQNAISVYRAGVLSGFGGYATCALATDGQILVSIGIAAVTAGAPDGHVQPVWCGLFNPDNGTWVRLTSPIWAADGTIVTPGNNYPGWAVNPSDQRLLTVGDKYVTQLEAPAAANLSVIPGTRFPASVANDASFAGFAWTNPANAEVSDGVFATAASGATLIGKYAGTAVDDASNGGSGAWVFTSLAQGAPDSNPAATGGMFFPDKTHYLKLTNYNMSIPANATITGISVTVRRRTANYGDMVDSRISLVKAGAVQATNRSAGASWPVAYTEQTYGGASDLWGTTWTPADVNASNFGVVVEAICTLPVPGAGPPIPGEQAEVDDVGINVYWTLNTNYLATSSHGFAIPSTAAISGIQVNVIRSSDIAGTISDGSVRLYKAGALTGTEHVVPGSSVPTSPTVKSWGGPSDLWGVAWTPADINAAGFGAAYAATEISSLFFSPTAQVDSISITVYYTVGSPTNSSSFVQNSALYDKMADGTFQPIPALWKTHLSPLVSSAHRASQAKRFFLDYVFQGTGILASAGWSVVATDETGGQYASAQLPLTSGSQAGSVSGGSQTATAAVQRFNQDMVNEMHELQFAVSWADSVRGSAPSNIVPELYGVGIEFQPTRDTVTGG